MEIKVKAKCRLLRMGEMGRISWTKVIRVEGRLESQWKHRGEEANRKRKTNKSTKKSKLKNPVDLFQNSYLYAKRRKTEKRWRA